MRMMIILLAKICKLSWFDHPELQTMVNEITTLYNVREPPLKRLDESRALLNRPLHSRPDSARDDICEQGQKLNH